MARTKKNRDFLLDAWLGALVFGALASFGVGAAATLRGARTPKEALLTVGLVAPIALLASFGVALWSLLVHGPSRLRLGLVLESSKRRFRVLLAGPLLFVAFWLLAAVDLVLVAHLGDRLPLVGLLSAFLSLLVLLAGSVALEFAATALSRSVPRPNLGLTFGGAAALFLGPLFLASKLGQTSGAGGALGIMGVLRRDEINYRPLGEIFLLVTVSYVGAIFLGRIAKRSERSRLAAVSVAACFAALVFSARMSSSDAISIERSRSLASIALASFSRLSDGDRDGNSDLFGGGDCRDDDPKITPGALDVPENGVDEDCSGSDAKRAAPKPKSPENPETPKTAAVRAKNVLLLTVDTLRYDLGYTGEAKHPNVSPNLDALSKKSLLFEHAYSLASYTSKSLSPMLIGRYASECERTFAHFDRFAPSIPWLQERLQKAGVTTVSVQGYWYFSYKGTGYERGFDVINDKSTPAKTVIEGDGSSNGERIASELIAELGKLKGSEKPFFVWGHWVEPHAEYVKHEGFDFGKRARDMYDSEVAFVDQQLGRIFAELEKLGLAETTAVIFTSDHGEAFGEHDFWRHGFELWDELVHVPLLISVPGVEPRRVTARRSSIDMARTILELFGVEAERDGPNFVRGTSLLEDRSGPFEERPVLVDMPEGPFNAERRAFLDGKYKLVMTNGKPLGLYDMESDPGEKKDLQGDAALLAKVRASYETFAAELSPRAATKK